MQSNSSDYYLNGGAGGDGSGGSPRTGGMAPQNRSGAYNGNSGPLPLPQYRDLHDGPRDPRNGVPSPPSSIARSSDGTGLYSDSGYGSLRGIVLEEELALHHAAIKRLLAHDLINDRNPKQKRARDKLLRLSIIQFQELSTDVYDELQRRQQVNDRRDSGQIPPYLLPKESIHPKRNHARMRLSTLPVPRFRDLAKDVFYELERRYPHFQDNGVGDIPVSPTGSMTSMRSFPHPPGPGRAGSPGPGRMGSPGPTGLRNGPQLGFPSGSGVSGPGGQNQFGRPLPKTFQSNTIIPNKSTMVEEEDDDGPVDDDDLYGLDENNKRSTKDTLSGMTGHPDGPVGMKAESFNSRLRGRADSIKSLNGSMNGSIHDGINRNETDKKLIADYRSQLSSLQQRLEDLEITLREKEAEAIRIKDEEMQRESSILQDRKEWQEEKFELESRIATLQSQQDSLQEELSRAKVDYGTTERSLQDQLATYSRQLEEMGLILDKQRHNESGQRGYVDDDYEVLLTKHGELKAELKDQREVTEEVRKEATEFLKEMKELSMRSAESWEREEKLSLQLAKLQEEVKEWKSRYARAKTQLRSIRAASMGLALQQSPLSLAARDSLTNPDGIIKDIHVTKFQISIDDLLRTARFSEPNIVLDNMKVVVMAARAITDSINQATASPIVSDEAEGVAKLKSRVSATANNLITAAKNHATANGLSPVSLLDAAASHLTASVVELIKKVKIKPSPLGESDDSAEESSNEDSQLSKCSRQYYTCTQSNTHDTKPPEQQRVATPPQYTSPEPQQHSRFPLPSTTASRMSIDSVYSRESTSRQSRSSKSGPNNSIGSGGKRDGLSMMSPPRDFPKGPLGVGVGSDRDNVQELKSFVENHFDGIVKSIQDLLATIRSDGSMDILRSQIFEIANVVGNVVDSTQSSMSFTGNFILRERGQVTVRKLGDCRTKMLEMTILGDGALGTVSKEFKGKLAGLSFDMAREIKELVKTVEDIDMEARGGSFQNIEVNAMRGLLHDEDL